MEIDKTSSVILSKVPKVPNLQKDKVAQSHQGLVKHIARQMTHRVPPHVQLDDLIQVGMIGLLEAKEKFDETKGASFETYAGIRIRGAMLDEVRKIDWVPRSVHQNAKRIAKAIHEIENTTHKSANDEEIAKQVGIPLTEYYQILQDSHFARIFRFEELVQEGDVPFEETYAIETDNNNPYERALRDDFTQKIAENMSHLPDKEKLVLALYYKEELNLKEVGRVLGVSESRICQIHSQATLRLKSRMKNF